MLVSSRAFSRAVASPHLRFPRRTAHRVVSNYAENASLYLPILASQCRNLFTKDGVQAYDSHSSGRHGLERWRLSLSHGIFERKFYSSLSRAESSDGWRSSDLFEPEDSDELDIATKYPRRVRSCAVCGNDFTSDRLLHAHLFAEHPQDAEMLMMDKYSIQALERSGQQYDLFARLTQEGNETLPKIELDVLTDSASSEQVNLSTEQHSQMYRIDVDCVRMNSNIRYSSQRMLSRERGQLKRKDRNAGRAWQAIVRWLDFNSVHVPHTWVKTTVSGKEWHLVDFYHHLLAKHQKTAYPLYPTSAFDQGIMTVYSLPEVVEDLKSEYLERLTTLDDGPRDDIEIGQHILDHHVFSTLKRSTEVIYNTERASPDFDDYVQAPWTWSKESLCSYIKKVIVTRRSTMMGHSQDDQLLIQSILNHTLFESPSTQSCVSWLALYQAFSFFVEHRLLDRAWEFLKKMDKIKFEPSVEFFNKFLAGCGPENREALRSILQEMDNRNIKANAGTWIAVMSAAPGSTDSQTVVHRLRGERAMRDPEDDRKLAKAIISYSFGLYLDRGGSIPTYLQFLDNTFSLHWPSDEAASELVDILARRLRMVDAVLLAVSLTDRVKIYTTTRKQKGAMHAILAHCFYQRNMDLAVWTVVYFTQKRVVKSHDYIILNFLFKTAWRTKMHNVLRVVWKYAIAKGEIDLWTKDTMLDCLEARTNDSSASFDAPWKASAAVVACDIDPRSAPKHLTPLEVLNLEFGSFWYQEPKEPFHVALAKALVVDKLWRANNKHLSGSIEWKLENSIKIGMRKKPISR